MIQSRLPFRIHSKKSDFLQKSDFWVNPPRSIEKRLSWSRGGAFWGVWLLALLLLAGCGDAQLPVVDLGLGGAETQEASPLPPLPAKYMARYDAQQRILVQRPPGNLAAVVERYLREFQPGPTPRLFQTTILTDRNGVLLAQLDGQDGQRTWVSVDKISQFLIDATVATEDSTFYTNFGVDAMRLAGAALQNSQEGGVVSGASTITMQLARNLFMVPDKRFEQSMDRKLVEIQLAQDLTLLFTKNELMEIYLNLINYGHRAYGIEAAARTYFAKPAADLTLAEATLLSGIPQQPASLDPLANFEAARGRQRIVLDLMVRHGYLLQDEADAAFAEPLTLNPQPDQITPVLAPHFVQYVDEVLSAQLDLDTIRGAGLTITTTLDLDMQNLGQEIVAQKVAAVRERYNMTNAALVALKPGTDEILVMVGSANFDDESIDGQVNVTNRRRQPGSAIKPVLYAIALDDTLISPATVIWDTPVTYETAPGVGYSPRNYDGKYHGPVTVRSALANSYNVPAVKLLDGVTVDRMVARGQEMGLASLNRPGAFYGLSLTLGGGEVTLLELASAFHMLNNQGRFVPPLAVLTVLDSAGDPAPLPPAALPQQVVSEETAFLVTDILSDVKARQPAFGVNNPLVLSRPAAAKTGTTTDYRDNWTVGYTRYLVAGVWAGNNRGQPLRNSSGVTGAAPIWHEFMEAVLADKAMLERLGAPVEEAAGPDGGVAAGDAVGEVGGENSPETGIDPWAFAAPDGVVKLDACPPKMTCREGGEYFSQAWLDAAGDLGPLADSVARVETIPLYAMLGGYSWVPVYCEDPYSDQGQIRDVLRLSGKLGLADSTSPPEPPPPTALTPGDDGRLTFIPPAPAGLSAPLQPASVDYTLTLFRRDEMERFRTLDWAIRYSVPVSLGYCANLSVYTVAAGDSWSVIGRRVNLAYPALQAINPQAVRESGVLRVGDRLLVPTRTVIEFQDIGLRHTVLSGESWNVIANTYDVPIQILQQANPQLVRAFAILRPDDELVIPVQVAGQTAAVP